MKKIILVLMAALMAMSCTMHRGQDVASRDSIYSQEPDDGVIRARSTDFVLKHTLYMRDGSTIELFYTREPGESEYCAYSKDIDITTITFDVFDNIKSSEIELVSPAGEGVHFLGDAKDPIDIVRMFYHYMSIHEDENNY